MQDTDTEILDYDPICDECGSLVIDDTISDTAIEGGEQIRILYCSNPTCESHNLM